MRLVINALLFQIAWWCAALFDVSSTIILLILVFFLFLTVESKKQALFDLMIVFPLMLLIEYVFIANGLFRYSYGDMPLYIVLLWVCLVLTLRVSLRFVFQIKRYLGVSILMVAVPFTYYGASKLGALTIQSELLIFFLLFGLVWSIGLFLSEYISSLAYEKSTQIAL